MMNFAMGFCACLVVAVVWPAPFAVMRASAANGVNWVKGKLSSLKAPE
jgi:hypothetical protein